MVATRSSQASDGDTPSNSQNGSPNDLKRKDPPASASPSAKRGKKESAQKSLEETMDLDKGGQPSAAPASNGDKADGHKPEAANGNDTKVDSNDKNAEEQSNGHDSKTNGEDSKTNGEDSKTNGEDSKTSKGASKGNEDDAQTKESQPTETKQEAPPNDAVQSSQGRAEKISSNVLEKGIIYFFARGRVGIEDPADVKDIARSYIVMRPLPKGAKLTEGTIEDHKNNRLLAVPKKVLPKSHQDAFMVFVEKGPTTLEDLRDNFMKGSTYDTKTTGTSHSPPVTPIAEGVYAITSQGRDSHLAYMITIPQELSKVQEGMGLKEKGSFVLSTKNPEQKGPANAALPQGPGFPKEIMDEFQGRRWMGLQPQHLDYANAQCLFIGEGAGEFRRAGEKTDRDEQNDKESPQEEIENLEGEDAHRAQKLNGDDSIFDDLGISHKEYPKVKTTW